MKLVSTPVDMRGGVSLICVWYYPWQRLSNRLGVSLPETLVGDFPTLRQIETHVDEKGHLYPIRIGENSTSVAKHLVCSASLDEDSAFMLRQLLSVLAGGSVLGTACGAIQSASSAAAVDCLAGIAARSAERPDIGAPHNGPAHHDAPHHGAAHDDAPHHGAALSLMSRLLDGPPGWSGLLQLAERAALSGGQLKKDLLAELLATLTELPPRLFDDVVSLLRLE